MIELYIENRKIDLVDDLEINFTYETIDPDKLSSIKNSFSKQVNIPGTPNNNITFGHIFRYDKYIPIVQPSNIGTYYDPHKRINWFINKNGTLVNRGYCTLDNIIVKNERDITYQLTLYGGIGEFFYSLSYDEYGNNKTLYDLFWNWRPKLSLYGYGSPMTQSEENENILMKCSADIVAHSYHSLNPFYTSDGTTEIDKDIVFVPCYTGLYEDFDSKHMIVNTNDNSLYETAETLSRLRNAFPNSKVDEEGETYTTLTNTFETTGFNKFGLVTFSREIDPWEAGDLRVSELPVAVRLSKLMEVISNPDNNGGYEVIWDDSIKNSYHWLYSWIMLGKLKKEKEEFSKKVFYPNSNYNDQKTEVRVDITFSQNQASVSTTNAPSYNIVENTSMEKGNYIMKLNVFPKYYLTGYNLDNFLRLRNFFSGTCKINEDNRDTFFTWVTSVLLHKIYDDNNNAIRIIADIFYYTSNSTYYFGLNTLYIDENLIKQTLQSKIAETFLNAGERINEYRYHKCILNYTSDVVSDLIGGFKLASFKCDSEEIKTSFTLSDDVSNLRIEQTQGMMQTMCYTNAQGTVTTVASVKFDDALSTIRYNTTPTLNVDGFTVYPQGPYGIEYANRTFTSYYANSAHQEFNYNAVSFELNEGLQNGIVINRESGFNIINLDKKTLFANSNTPMKYLSDYCKLMNYKFICDNTENKIYIKPLKNYYINKIVDLEGKVDYNRPINIKNITTKYKGINIGLDTPETYPVTVFNKISKDKFNTKKYDTGIKYNAEETNMLKDLSYKNTIDWQQSSIYYNLNPQFPRPYNVDSISWTLFKVDNLTDEINLKKKEFITPGTDLSNFSTFASKDFMPKVALFDNNNKYVDVGSSLIFLNGFVKNYDYNKLRSDTSTITLTPTTINERHVILADGDVRQSSIFDIYQYSVTAEDIVENVYKMTCDYSPDEYVDVWSVNYIDANGNKIGVEYSAENQIVYNDVILNIPEGTREIWCNFRRSDTTKKMDAVIPYEILTPDSIILSSRVNLSGNIVSSTLQDIYVYNITPADIISKRYYVTASFDSQFGAYTVNYRNSSNIVIGTEYFQQDANLVNAELHIPSATREILINFRKDDTSKKLAISNTLYSISPRVMLSNDTNEMYYFNQDRCYIWDFVYADFFNTWGMYNMDRKSVASSWVLPYFSRDLYNTYSNGETYTIAVRDSYTDNSYIQDDGTIVSDNDYEIFNYSINQNYHYAFSGKFEQGFDNVAVVYLNTFNEVVGSECLVSNDNLEFEDYALSVPINATQISINVRKINSEYTVLKYTTDYVGWSKSGTKVASWNFVDQEGLDNVYSISNTDFIRDNNFSYTKTIGSIGSVGANEYRMDNVPSDDKNTNRIYNSNWKDYIDDLYERNTRDVTAYINLTEFGEVNEILRYIYSWKSHLWIITKIENFKLANITNDKFVKVTLHKIYQKDTWTD